MTPCEWRISDVTKDDLEAVCAIASSCFDVAWGQSSLEAECAQDHAWCRVLRRASTVCAFSSFWIVGDEVQLHHLATDPRFRRTGCGSRLLDDMLTVGRQHGATRAYLEVRRSNRAALELYQRFGFRSIGVRPRYYSDNEEDAIVMLRDAAAVSTGGSDLLTHRGDRLKMG